MSDVSREDAARQDAEAGADEELEEVPAVAGGDDTTEPAQGEGEEDSQ